MIEAEEYIKMKSDKLPYTTDWGLILREVEIRCPTCNELTEDQKYRFNEFVNSLDIVGVGICKKCKQIVTAKPLRTYRDGRVMSINDNGEWVEGSISKIGWFEKLINKVIKWKNS
jgi:hypothetical protein